MNWRAIVPWLFVAVPVLIFLLVKVLLWRHRKARWREIAQQLGALYGSESLTRCGTIRGQRYDRSYIIEIKTARAGQNGEYAVTHISAPCRNTGVELALPPAFFQSGFNPTEVLKRVGYEEEVRVFVTSINLDRIKSIPLSPEEQTRLSAALQGWKPSGGPLDKLVRKNPVMVQEKQVVYSENGVITDSARMEGLVALLTDLALRFETSPVTEKNT